MSASSIRFCNSASRLFAWIRPDASGAYSFRSIRPGGYPRALKLDGVERLIPAHVHYEISAPGFESKRFQLVFDDDPRMDAHWRQWAKDGGHPVAHPQRDASGVWQARCDIVLQRTGGAR